MPSERFWNLPDSKRERIRRAAVQEMERVPYDEVSINKIVHTACIPRGSFYQYFADKDDLLGFVAEDYSLGMERCLDESLQKTGGDAFQAVRDVFDYTVQYGTRPDMLRLCRNLFTSRSMHLKTTREMMDFAQQRNIVPEYFERISIERFRYTDAGDLLDILEMLILLFRESVERIFVDIDRREEIHKSFLNKLKIIQNGILKEAGK